MMMSIAEIQARGVTLGALDAVAVAQQLISSLREPSRADGLEPPFGPPSAANVFVHDDGSVTCRECQTTPTVSEVGILLDALLPYGSPRVPGALRYTIARALLEVDVPPFASLDDFSRDLARHETRPRAAVVSNLLARATGATAVVPALRAAATAMERRQARASQSELRRALREAEVRLYEHQAPVRVLDLKPPPPSRIRTFDAAFACLAAGLILIGTGEAMHRRHGATQIAQPAAVTTPASAPEAARSVAEPAPMPSERGIIAVHDDRPVVKRVRLETRRAAAKRTARPVVQQTVPRPSRKGLLDRLKLGWLRNAI